MKQLIAFVVLLVLLSSCSTKSSEIMLNKDDTSKAWVIYQDTVPAGFVLTFTYPNNLVLADVIDNCRSVGYKKKNEEKHQGTDITNSRHWNICMQDTADYTVEYLINSWKEIFKKELVEKRDTLTIENTKALRVILKSDQPNEPYRQLIYFKKFSTLFEIYNIYEGTNKDFETFYNSLTINETRKTSN